MTDSGDTLVTKENKFSLDQYHTNAFEEKKIQKISYASIVRSLMYVQICTHSDIMYIVGMLGRYLNNFRLDH